MSRNVGDAVRCVEPRCMTVTDASADEPWRCDKHARPHQDGDPMTLLEDLEKALQLVHTRAVYCENDDDAKYLSDLHARLRAAATRLREEMEMATAQAASQPEGSKELRDQAECVRVVLESINGGTVKP